MRWKAKQGDSIRHCLASRHRSTTCWSHLHWFLNPWRERLLSSEMPTPLYFRWTVQTLRSKMLSPSSGLKYCYITFVTVYPGYVTPYSRRQ
jgi:hypothetical protein